MTDQRKFWFDMLLVAILVANMFAAGVVDNSPVAQAIYFTLGLMILRGKL